MWNLRPALMLAKCGVQCLNLPAPYGRSPSSTPPESRRGSANKPLGSWGVNCRDAHAYLQLSDINIWFAMEKIDHLYFYLTLTLGDVKEAARKSGLIKWQEMWEKSDKGRHLFQL